MKYLASPFLHDKQLNKKCGNFPGVTILSLNDSLTVCIQVSLFKAFCATKISSLFIDKETNKYILLLFNLKVLKK